MFVKAGLHLRVSRINGYLVMCEVLNADGTPHATNGRATIRKMMMIFGSGMSKNISYGITNNLPLGSQETRLSRAVLLFCWGKERIR